MTECQQIMLDDYLSQMREWFPHAKVTYKRITDCRVQLLTDGVVQTDLYLVDD